MDDTMTGLSRLSGNKIAGILLLFVFMPLLYACEQNENATSTAMSLSDTGKEPARSQVPAVSLLENIKQHGKLTVLTTNSATTYSYHRDNELTGTEYDITPSGAKRLKVEVEERF